MLTLLVVMSWLSGSEGPALQSYLLSLLNRGLCQEMCGSAFALMGA